MATFTIPLTTLAPGSHDFPASGGAPLADSDTSATVSIDRTVAGGLNVTPQARIEAAAWQSNDGGATWMPLASAGANGGAIRDRHNGGNENRTGMTVTLWPGTGRLGRARVDILHVQVAVSGTLVIS